MTLKFYESMRSFWHRQKPQMSEIKSLITSMTQSQSPKTAYLFPNLSQSIQIYHHLATVLDHMSIVHDERWLEALSIQLALRHFLLPAASVASYFKTCRHVFAFEEGKLIPGELVQYQTAPNHYSLEPAIAMELAGIIPISAR